MVGWRSSGGRAASSESRRHQKLPVDDQPAQPKSAAIRTHLAHIAKMFSEGDFSAPMFIHDQTPPGVAKMREHKKEIEYRYEETSGGGRVVISTSMAGAIRAIHEFLRFQIAEHRTGDPLDSDPK